jgi:hypothetical protein
MNTKKSAKICTQFVQKDTASGDFAAGERTNPIVSTVGDFATGEHQLPITKAVGDFASGEHTMKALLRTKARQSMHKAADKK